MILGLNYNGMHDSSICLLDDDGRILCAVSEERLSRVKQDGSFPWKALALVDIARVEVVGVPYLSSAPAATGSDEIFRKVSMATSLRPIASYPPVWLGRLESLERPICFFDHHDMHAYTAFALSGWPEALAMTADYGAYNCGVTSGVFYVASGQVEKLASAAHGDLVALAALYSDVTALLGFTPCKHEGKVTGLAASGVSRADCRAALWELHAEIRHDRYRLYDWVAAFDEDTPPFLAVNRHQAARYRRRLPYSDMDLARAAQDLLEEKIVTVLHWVADTYGTELPLLLSGGVFANVKVNLEVARIGFRSVFVCPPMGDEGLAVGAAYAVLDRVPGKAKKVSTPVSMALGPVPGAETHRFLRDLGVVFAREGAPGVRGRVVATLAEGGSVALVRGRQEFGPRALGHRSILASPVDAGIGPRLNAKLRRTEFMPFAPLLREERLEDLFDLSQVSSDVRSCLPYMTICLPIRPEAASRYPAVVHVDGTARPQVLRREQDPDLHTLLAEYEKATGLAAVINTSFNIHDEPLVSDVADAVRAFFIADLDLMVVDDCVVTRTDNQPAARLTRALWATHPDVAKARQLALNESFGRQIIDGPGEFSLFA